jgi:3-oxoacyl-[acyl-carrier protein] reductase
MRLRDKVALVTGGSRGIGAAIVERLARERAHVALTYVSKPDQAHKTEEVARSLGVKALAIQADSADPKAVVAAVERTVAELGGLDILVNNAGVVVFGAIEEIKLEDVDRILAVNVRPVFIAVQAAVRHMGRGGRIITIGSCNTDRMPVAGGGIYTMTKSAIVGLTRGLARDLGPRGITINNIQPGPISTDMNPATGQFADVMRSFMAIPEYGTGADVAAMVAYLAGAEAAFVTGASLTIDGGYTA